MNFRKFFKLVFIITFTTMCIGVVGGLIAHAFKSFDDGRVNVVIAGLDAGRSRADTILLASFSPSDGKAVVLSIPRDTRIEAGGYERKINSVYARGNESLLLDEVRKLTGINAKYYVVVDFKAFHNIINSIDGVKIDIPINMIYDDPYQNLHIYLLKGPQVLNGEKAEQFVRFRKNNDGTGYPRGDIDRIEAQKAFMKAAAEQLLQPKNIIKLPQIIKAVTENVQTNIGSSDIGNMIKVGLGMKKENINFITLPGEGKYIDDISYYISDKQKTIKLMESYFAPADQRTAAADKAAADKDEAPSAKYENVPVSGTSVMNKQSGTAGPGEMSNSGTAAVPGTAAQGAVSAPTVSTPQKKVRVEVLNATDKRGLAAKVAEELKKNGYEVVKVGNYNTSSYISTRMIERNETKAGSEMKKLLKYGVVLKEPDSSLGVDVTVILGDDYDLNE